MNCPFGKIKIQQAILFPSLFFNKESLSVLFNWEVLLVRVQLLRNSITILYGKTLFIWFNKKYLKEIIRMYTKICLPINFSFVFSDQLPINYGYFMVKRLQLKYQVQKKDRIWLTYVNANKKYSAEKVRLHWRWQAHADEICWASMSDKQAIWGCAIQCRHLRKKYTENVIGKSLGN